MAKFHINKKWMIGEMKLWNVVHLKCMSEGVCICASACRSNTVYSRENVMFCWLIKTSSHARATHARVCGKNHKHQRNSNAIFYNIYHCSPAYHVHLHTSLSYCWIRGPSCAWQCHLVVLFDCWWRKEPMAMETCGLLDENGRCSQQLFFNIEPHIVLLSARK